jgi:hypothetical protein
MAIRTASGQEVEILQYIGAKPHQWYSASKAVEYVKIRLLDQNRVVERDLAGLTADGGQDEMDAALATARANTIATRLTKTRKQALWNMMLVEQGNTSGERMPSNAYEWLEKQGLTTTKYPRRLNDTGRALARKTYIAERGTPDLWRSVATYYNRKSGVTGFMELLKALPTMLTTQKFAGEFANWRVEPTWTGGYRAIFGAWNDPRGQITITPHTHIGYDDLGERVETCDYRAEIMAVDYRGVHVNAQAAGILAQGLREAAVIMERLNATL